MISKELKNRALELRREGLSYNAIREEIKVSKATLWYWFSKQEWSKEISLKNAEKIREGATKRLLAYTDYRRGQLDIKYENAKLEAEKEFLKFKSDPIFIASLMLYLGEGDKSDNGHSLRMGNIDPYVLMVFIKFLKIFCKAESDKIKFWLLCYPDHNVGSCEEWWIEKLNIQRHQLYKTQVIQGKHKTKRLPYGVGNITLSGKVLKVKVLRWIVLMCEELMRA